MVFINLFLPVRHHFIVIDKLKLCKDFSPVSQEIFAIGSLTRQFAIGADRRYLIASCITDLAYLSTKFDFCCRRFEVSGDEQDFNAHPVYCKILIIFYQHTFKDQVVFEIISYDFILICSFPWKFNRSKWGRVDPPPLPKATSRVLSRLRHTFVGLFIITKQTFYIKVYTLK